MKTGLFITAMLMLLVTGLSGQDIKSATIIEFEDPFEMITIASDDIGEVSLPLDSAAVVTAKKGGALKFADVQEGNLVNLSILVRDKKRFITKIEVLSLIEEGKIRFRGLFEGYNGATAFIDGRKVLVSDKATFKGASKGEGKMNIDFIGFEDPILKKGYYMQVAGRMEADGTILAHEIIVKKNTSTDIDETLVNLVNQSFNSQGLTRVQSPQGIFNAANGLYNGNITIGDLQYKLSTDIRLQGYVNEVGYKVIPEYINEPSWQKENQKIDFRFYVVDDQTPNAFAWPNGMVFIHTGLLKIIENEAQLAFVLSHEISHVLYEHGSARFKKSENIKEAMGYGKSALNLAEKTGVMKGLKIFKKKERVTPATGYSYEYYAALQKIYGLGTNSNPSQADQMLSVALNSIGQKISPDVLSGLFSKDQENQADRVGLYYTQLAGYDIREIPRFWSKMMEKTDEPGFLNQMATGFKSLLKNATAVNFELSGNMTSQLLNSSTEMIVDNIFKSIYMSHPLTKNRLKSTNQLLSTTYKEKDFAGLKVGTDEFKSYTGSLK